MPALARFWQECSAVLSRRARGQRHKPRTEAEVTSGKTAFRVLYGNDQQKDVRNWSHRIACKERAGFFGVEGVEGNPLQGIHGSALLAAPQGCKVIASETVTASAF